MQFSSNIFKVEGFTIPNWTDAVSQLHIHEFKVLLILGEDISTGLKQDLEVSSWDKIYLYLQKVSKEKSSAHATSTGSINFKADFNFLNRA